MERAEQTERDRATKQGFVRIKSEINEISIHCILALAFTSAHTHGTAYTNPPARTYSS